ncbi:MAG: PGF-pre-PGF domain-containing protein [Candidatus Aenigmarchaeota archaeon]|nr:PGF-pre-PGF domain-containing protein [Candidatus Aenigmarchaeota archaeon]
MKINISAFLIAILLSPLAYASMSIETFTCNGMSGTVVVENGATFSCQASIKNEDTQNPANLGSVALLVEGSWAEKTSYTGTGFSSTLGAGASTTADFAGIKAVTPAATNKFQSIQLDNSADTFVTNTNVNVITVKSLTVTASSSSEAQGTEFSVEAAVIAGGDLGSVTLTWSGSGGCSLSSGHSASKEVGSLSHNTEATRSWKIVQGSADCVNTVTASGTSSSITTTKSKSAAVAFTGSGGSSSSSGSSSSGGGGGAGGGGGGAEAKTIAAINPGTPAVVTFSTTALQSLSIEVANAVTNVKISVQESSSPSVPAPAEDVYKYLDITVTNLSDTNIKSATIAFKVKLNRYNNGIWTMLATSLLSENATTVKYTATTPGFSIFAITAGSTAPGQEPVRPSGSPEKPSQPEETQKQEKPLTIGNIEIPKPLVDYGPIILIIILAVISVFGWLHYHKYPHKKGYSYNYKSK